MAVTPTIYPKSVVWNSLTWDASTAGGPVGLRYLSEATDIASRTGDDEYPRTIFMVDKMVRLFVTLQDVKQTFDPGTMSDMTVTLSTKAGTQTVTFPDVIYQGQSANQPRAALGETELSFAVQVSDGQTNPIDATLT